MTTTPTQDLYPLLMPAQVARLLIHHPHIVRPVALRPTHAGPQLPVLFPQPLPQPLPDNE